MTIGEKILSMRKARGWSQEELAEQIGVTRQAVSRWESDSAKPDADKIISVCDLFGVSADYLLRDLSQASVNESELNSQKKKQNKITGSQIGGIVLSSLSIVLLFVFVLVGATQGGTHEIIYGDGTFRKYEGFMAFVSVNHLQWLLYLLAAVGMVGIALLVTGPVLGRFEKLTDKNKGN